MITNKNEAKTMTKHISCDFNAHSFINALTIKNRTCYHFKDIIELEDFDLDNFLIDGKLHENILIYDI